MKNQFSILAIFAAILLAALAASPVGAANGQDGQIATHIIVFNDGVDARDAAGSLASAHGLTVNNVYSHALSGMAAVVPAGRLKALANDPRVAFVEENQAVQAFLPTGIDRSDADLNSVSGIAGDGGEVDVDVAIIDTGIDLDHPDLNVFKWTNCARKGPKNTSCKGGDSGADDGAGHGTHVAGTVAARDNGDSVVGMAPGARLWAVKVLGNDGSGWMNWIIAGVDYVAQNSASIEVANMSLGCACSSSALDAALTNAVAQGVTFAVAAGNSMSDSAGYSPANHDDVITVSAVADFDGQPGGLSDQTVTFSSCTERDDDSLACFSNFGASVDIAAPGVSILSTYMGGGTATMSGTSMASPHVAGAAALLLAVDSTLSPADVRAALVASAWAQSGPGGFDGDTDGIAEPMLNAGSGWTPPPPPEAALLVSIAVTPVDAQVVVGGTQQFTATGSYDDSSTADITASVTWASDAGTVASVDDSGLATGLSTGFAGISATQDTIGSNSASLEVVDAPPPPPAGTVVSVTGVDHLLSGGKNGDKDLRVTVNVADDLGNPVESATVSITLNNVSSGASWTGTASTGADGSVTFRLRNAPSGCYSTDVDDLVAAGLTWDGNSGPFGRVCKSTSNNNKNGANSAAFQAE